VFVATTNESEYLTDPTGGRRFWPAKVGTVNVGLLRSMRDQLWGEARVRFERGEAWYLKERDLEQLAQHEQEERREEDPWTALIERWLLLPSTIVNHAQGVTTDEVLREALTLEPQHLTPAAAGRAGVILRSLGWKPRQRREGGSRVRRYVKESQPPKTGCDAACDTDASGNEPQSHVTARHTHTPTRGEKSNGANGRDGAQRSHEGIRKPGRDARDAVTLLDDYDRFERDAIESEVAE
jgi:predicted P-loop ATPase